MRALRARLSEALCTQVIRVMVGMKFEAEFLFLPSFVFAAVCLALLPTEGSANTAPYHQCLVRVEGHGPACSQKEW